MLEWYRVGEPYARLMAGYRRLGGAGRAGAVCGFATGPAMRPCRIERLSVADAFRDLAGIDLLATMDAAGVTGCGRSGRRDGRGSALRIWRAKAGRTLFSRVLSEQVEPHLGQGRLTVLDRYPAAEAALARRCADDPRVAERFEVYACGVELANGFGELTDPVEQRARFDDEMAIKARVYGETLSD